MVGRKVGIKGDQRFKKDHPPEHGGSGCFVD